MAWGKRRYAERGIVKPGVIPYGYRHGRNGEWNVVEEEAAVVKRIFKDTIEGKSYTVITRELNLDGVRTSTGNGQWWIQSVVRILTSENYRGNYLYQKTYMKDSLSDNPVRNDGALPQFLIENHHAAIIDRDDWDRAQEIIEERAEKFANRSSIKYPEDKSKNKSFEGVMRCGVCGSSVGYTRVFKGSVERPEWRCNKASKSTRKDACDALRLNQKYLEQHFMKTLLNIRTRKSVFKAKVLQLINSLELTPEEEPDKLEVLSMIDHLNQTLYKAVDMELSKKGQDSKKVDELTEGIINLQNKIKEYTDRKFKVVKLGQELTWFMKAIDIVEEESIHRPEVLAPENKMYFLKEIYERSIKEAWVQCDGKVFYKLHLGIEWSIDYVYEEFQEAIIDRRKEMRKTEKLDFLNGSDVEAMLVWCREPKKLGELYAFMAERKKISDGHFRRTIIKPLLNMGKIKRTIPEDPLNRFQKYISEDAFTE